MNYRRAFESLWLASKLSDTPNSVDVLNMGDGVFLRNARKFIYKNKFGQLNRINFLHSVFCIVLLPPEFINVNSFGRET